MTAQPARKLYYSPREVAEARGCSGEHVRRMILRGELKAVRNGNRYKVPASELQRLGGAAVAGHEALSSAPERNETVRELRRLYAEMGRLLAEIE